MTTAKIEQPHVYGALSEILKNLSVEKNGTLPGNMGGKPYITASDAAAEVKHQFVENNLVFLPTEEVIKHETIQFKDRLNVTIVVTGTYTIVSTVDGSSVTVSGTGDGLATGTAVASNIASTNAFKNALLRTFLITEQSVEDASKNGDQAPEVKKASAAQARVDKARPVAKPAANAPAGDVETIKELQAKIREAIGSGAVDRNDVNAAMDAGKAEGNSGVALQRYIIKTVGI